MDIYHEAMVYASPQVLGALLELFKSFSGTDQAEKDRSGKKVIIAMRKELQGFFSRKLNEEEIEFFAAPK